MNFLIWNSMIKELQNFNHFIPGSRLVAAGNRGSAHAGQMAITCQKLNSKNLWKVNGSYLCLLMFDKFIPLQETEIMKVDLKNLWSHIITNRIESISGRFYCFGASVQRTCRPTWRHAEWPNFSEQEVNQPCDEEQHTYIIELRGQ